MRHLTRTVLAFLMTTPIVLSLSFAPGGTGEATQEIVASAHAGRGSGGRGEDGQLGGKIWGNIKRFTSSYIVVDERTYHFRKDVMIETYSLKPDDRGNVRITLDERGKVTHVYFYGIDMPEVFQRYKM